MDRPLIIRRVGCPKPTVTVEKPARKVTAMRSGTGHHAREGTSVEDKPGGVVRRARWTSQHKRIEVRPVELRWRRRFTGTKQHVADARAFARFLLADCPAAEDAAWIVGELATNAILHSRTGRSGGTFDVEISRGHRWAQLSVIDHGGDGPVVPGRSPLTVADGLPESGMGLHGVGMLASHYGTCLTHDGHRVVWARLLTEPRSTIGAER